MKNEEKSYGVITRTESNLKKFGKFLSGHVYVSVGHPEGVRD